MATEHEGAATAMARGMSRIEPVDWCRLETAAFHAAPQVLTCLEQGERPTRVGRWLSARRGDHRAARARSTRLATSLAALPAARLAAIREDLLCAIAELRNRQLIDDATASRAAESPPGRLAHRLSSA